MALLKEKEYYGGTTGPYFDLFDNDGHSLPFPEVRTEGSAEDRVKGYEWGIYENDLQPGTYWLIRDCGNYVELEKIEARSEEAEVRYVKTILFSDEGPTVREIIDETEEIIPQSVVNRLEKILIS